MEADYAACILGLRDYVNKNGFKDVVLGLSGGIDSAICAALGVDALGKDRVRCVMLPYRYTSEESLKDAADCAKALGVRYDIVPIAEPVEGFLSALKPMFEGTESGVTEENLQSRARALSYGNFQQVRFDGCDHGQQVRNVGGLCNALWRHEWWLQPHQGRL